MTPAYQWLTSGVELPELDYGQLERWIEQVAAAHNRIVRSLNYIFCDDDKILEVNAQFLDHHYYTDVITFDDCVGKLLRGDIFISLDTVRSNAETIGCEYIDELYRGCFPAHLRKCMTQMDLSVIHLGFVLLPAQSSNSVQPCFLQNVLLYRRLRDLPDPAVPVAPHTKI